LIAWKIATDFSGTKEASQLSINEIGEVNIKLSKAILRFYNDNKSNGAFILIDAATNTTAGAGFIDKNPSPTFLDGRKNK
jgi:sulfate adenylyltransferase subunit 1